MFSTDRSRLARPRTFTAAVLTALIGAGMLWSTAAPAEPERGAGAPGAAAGKGPVGWDTFRHLDRMPEFSEGVQTKQFSGFDRKGGNDDGFDGTYSCLRQSGDGCVIAEKEGAGEITSIWFTRDGGDVSRTGNIKVELDGKTVLDAPLQDVVDGKLGAPFSFPLVANADQSSGGVNIKVPMPYRKSMRVTTDENPLFQHVAYREFADARGVKTFDPADKAQDVLRKLARYGKRDPKPRRAASTTTRKDFALDPGRSVRLASVRGAATISELRVRIPQIIGAPKPTLVEDDGRAFGGAGAYSQFKAKIDPANQGVRLTRRLDARIGNQKADVLVDGVKVAQWEPLPTAGEVFRDQVVDIPPSATAGKSEITIRNSFVSSDLDYNEFTYWIDSVVGGQSVRTDTMDLGELHAAEEAAHSYTIENQLWHGVRNAPYLQSPEEIEREAKRVRPSDELLRDVRVRIAFDGEQTVDAPLGEFFGSGLGEYEVRSLMSAMDTSKRGSYRAWWPMPFSQRATVSLYNGSQHKVDAGDAGVRWSRDRKSRVGPDAGYFRAISHRGETTPGRDWVFADLEGRGKFLGVHHTMWGEGEGDGGPFTNIRGYLEGDERVHVDGSRSPQMHGTGSEDFYEAGWYFNRGSFNSPFNGSTGHEQKALNCEFSCDSAFRLMVSDAVPYQSGLRFSIEHGPANDQDATYGSTAFTYGEARRAVRRTDAIDVGNRGSERSHRYHGGGAVTGLKSVFEGDFDDVEVSDEGRATNDPVSFRLATKARNEGVRLVRRSDQANAYQAVRVFVNGSRAGTWRQPLGNATQRWLEDSFELPRRLTEGRRRLRVELRPLSGSPPWHAARYEALTHLQRGSR